MFSSLLLVITDPYPPFFHLGPLTIRYYGVAYVLAFFFGLLLARAHLKQHGVSTATTESITFWAILVGLLGARLYYVAQSDPNFYFTHPQHLLAVWEGGMAFFGAIFAVFIVLLIAAWRLRLSFFLLADAAVLFAALGQPIGRLGNIANGEVLGAPPNLPWAISYTSPDSLAPLLGTPYTPTNLYEALVVLALLFVLLLARSARFPTGSLFLIYLVLYPLSQLYLFYYRTDPGTPVIYEGLKQAQLTSLFVLFVVFPIVAVFFLVSRHRARRNKRTKSATLQMA